MNCSSGCGSPQSADEVAERIQDARDLPHALDPDGEVMATYIHPDEVRDDVEVQQSLRTSMRDIQRGTTGGVIAEAIPHAELPHGVLQKPAGRVAIHRTPLQKLALRHEILHGIHEQRHGVPKTVGEILRSEWAAHAGTYLGKHGRRAGGSALSRLRRAVNGTIAATLRQVRST